MQVSPDLQTVITSTKNTFTVREIRTCKLLKTSHKILILTKHTVKNISRDDKEEDNIKNERKERTIYQLELVNIYEYLYLEAVTDLKVNCRRLTEGRLLNIQKVDGVVKRQADYTGR